MNLVPLLVPHYRRPPIFWFRPPMDITYGRNDTRFIGGWGLPWFVWGWQFWRNVKILKNIVSHPEYPMTTSNMSECCRHDMLILFDIGTGLYVAFDGALSLRYETTNAMSVGLLVVKSSSSASKSRNAVLRRRILPTIWVCMFTTSRHEFWYF